MVGRLTNIKTKQRGFTLPLSISVGISMLLLGSLMIARSNVDQVTGVAQVQTAGALSVAEAGVARTLSQLNSPNLAHLVTLSYDRSRGDGNPYLGEDQTLRTSISETVLNEWVTNCNGTIPASLIGGTVGTGSGQGTYTVLAYRYNSNTQTGSLLVEGRFRGSVSRVQVSVSRRDKAAAIAFPGLYGSDSVDLGNNDVLKVSTETGRNANVICGNCTAPSTASNSCVISASATAGIITTKGAVGGGPNSQIDGQAIITQLTLPTMPLPPESGDGRNVIATIDSSMTLPRTGDTHDTNGVYHYVINSIDLQGGGKTLTISPPSDKSVRLYVSGNITMSGNAAFAHSGTPDRFAILGGTSSQTMTFNGGTTSSRVFVYAPNAAVTINGGGSPGTNNIYGTVWAKTFRANGNNIDLQVPDNMPDLLRTTFGGTFTAGARSNAPSAPTSWSREGAVQ
jgi:hypothetical protein